MFLMIVLFLKTVNTGIMASCEFFFMLSSMAVEAIGRAGEEAA